MRRIGQHSAEEVLGCNCPERLAAWVVPVRRAVGVADSGCICPEKPCAWVVLVRMAADTEVGPQVHNLDRMAQAPRAPKELGSRDFDHKGSSSRSSVVAVVVRCWYAVAQDTDLD